MLHSFLATVLQRIGDGASDESFLSFVRLYVFDKCSDWARGSLGDIVADLLQSTESLGNPHVDLEQEKYRRTKFDASIRVLTNAVTSAKALQSLPSGLKVALALIKINITKNEEEALSLTKRMMIERFVVPLVSLPTEFSVLPESFSSATDAGKANVIAMAKTIQQAARSEKVWDRFAESLWELATPQEIENALQKKHSFDATSDVDLACFLATVSQSIPSAEEQLRNSEIAAKILSTADEWKRRNAVRDLVIRLRNTTTRLDSEILGLEKILNGKPKKDLHEAVVSLKEKLEGLRTLYVLASKNLNKRAHPSQWGSAGGCLSDVLKTFTATYGEAYLSLRFVLKQTLPMLSNRMMAEETKLSEIFDSFEQQNGRDLIELMVRELNGAASIVQALRQVAPRAPHPDYAACRAALKELEDAQELVERGEIESLLRSYKFQKFTIAGWKEMPKMLLGESDGIASTFRTHLLAGIVSHVDPKISNKPIRYFGHLFSDFFVVLSQIEMPTVGAGVGSPRTIMASSSPRSRSGSTTKPRITSKEKKRVLRRMASESTMAQLHIKDSAQQQQQQQQKLMFRIERVYPFAQKRVELQRMNRGFAIGEFEFTVEGPRETLVKWYDALRKCEITDLVDSSVAALDATFKAGSAVADDNSGGVEDGDLAAMIDQFCLYDTAVVRDRNVEDEDNKKMDKVLQYVDNANGFSRNSSAVDALKELFIPPEGVVVPQQQQQQPPQQISSPKRRAEEDETKELATMLKSSQYTLRLLRQTATLRTSLRDSSAE